MLIGQAKSLFSLKKMMKNNELLQERREVGSLEGEVFRLIS